jgi:hypothetical protein
MLRLGSWRFMPHRFFNGIWETQCEWNNSARVLDRAQLAKGIVFSKADAWREPLKNDEICGKILVIFTILFPTFFQELTEIMMRQARNRHRGE